jgi:hypothetical protein
MLLFNASLTGILWGGKMRLSGIALTIIAVSISACATSDQISLIAEPDQQSLTRDGVQALASKKKHFVMLKPGSRVLRSSARPSFVVAIRNMGDAPLEFRTSDLKAELVSGNRSKAALRIFSYKELVGEAEDERDTQLVIAALAGAANSFSAANAGYANTTGSYSAYGSNGDSAYGTYSARTYDPYRAQMAQREAANQTANDIAAIEADGERSLETLADTIIKDHTILPGEWYGGSVVLQVPPKSEDGAAEYRISVHVESEAYTFKVAQAQIDE